MLQVRKILFPVDFSERCSAAGAQVAAMATHFNAKLTLLHAMQIPPPWYGESAAAQLTNLVDIGELKKERQLTLDAYLQQELKGVEDVEAIVEQGAPDVVITYYARKEGVDLIMMPTHGYGPFRRLLVGSVTAKVLHDAECPIWTDVHENEPFARAGCRSVLCAVDLREESVREIQWAAGFASSYGAELTLMHAIPAIASLMPPEESHFHRYLIATAREHIAGLQQKAGTAARVCIEGGKVAESVCNAALQHHADLVVIGQGRMHETLGRLRTNACSIIRESPCPVVRV